MRLTFLGAAMMVTGSCYLLEIGNRKILVDCGMFQGSKTVEALNRNPFTFDPTAIDFVLLTHAHIDHSGLIPRLCKSGFKGNIYATQSTTDLCRIMLPDSGHIQEFEAELANRKGKRAGKSQVEPLYTVDDAYGCLKQFSPMPYGEEQVLCPEVTVKFNDAGHILGSSTIEVWVKENEKTTKLVFSGDLGQPNQPIIKDPTYIETADYVIMESTYGNRKHEHEQHDLEEKLGQIINDTVAQGGNVIIPAFAVGRTQTILYYLHQLLKAGKIPDIPVYIDSPLAISATDVFMHHPQDFDADAYNMISKENDNPLKLPQLVFTRTAEESKAINTLDRSAIIISASGMADAGRILHHLKHNLWKPETSVLLVGYQAQGSLGRRLLDGVKRVKIIGEEVSVRASIYNLDGFSAHADQEQLMNWVSHFSEPPANVFVIHGEYDMSQTLAALIKDNLNFPVYVPRYGDSANIDGRSFSIEASTITLIDPHVQRLHELLEHLDSEYMEFRKRIEQIIAASSGKIGDILSGVEKIRSVIKKTLEIMGNGNNGHK